MPSAYYFVLPYAEGEGTQMLLAQRQLIQRRIDGKEEVYGKIPDWAGQWVLVGGKGKEEEAATEAALRLFREQTGIDLSEKQAQTYGIEKQALQELRDKDYNPFTVLFLELSGEGLKKLKSDVRKNIDDRTVFDGVLQHADIVAGPLAPEKVGPIEPPPNGWRAFLVTNYYGGVQPGQFNTTIDILQQQITQRSKASAEWFTMAIGDVPEKPITGLLTKLEVSGASPSNGDWEATYQPESFITIRAVTDPDTTEVHKLIKWTGGTVDTNDPYGQRLVPRDTVTAKGKPVVVKASLNTALQATIEVVPSAVALAVANATQTNGNEYVANYDANNTNQITIAATTVPNSSAAWSHIVWTNGAQGDAVNTRLVPVDQITNAGASIDVTAAISQSISAAVKCQVLPRITGLSVVAYGFPLNGQDWYTYEAANPPVVVGVTTVPATPEAWAHLYWKNTTGPGKVDNERVVACLDVRNVVVTTGIKDGGETLLKLAVRTPAPLSGLTLAVHDITFGGGSGVRDDLNIGLGRQWVRNPANDPPQTYARNTAASLQANLDVIQAPNANIAIDVRATGFFPHANGGATNVVWQQNNIAVNAAPPPAQLFFAMIAGAPNLPNEVNYQDIGGGNFQLIIIWEMRLTGGGNNWVGFDITTHPFYVTLGAPVGNPRAYWTELKISCLAANGQNNPANVIAAIYQTFTAINPMTGVNLQLARTSDGATLKYWNLWAPPFNSAPGQTNSAMLANPNGNGSCLAFAMMLIDMFRLHGINTGTLVRVDDNWQINAAAVDSGAFLVKNWTFLQPPYGPASSGNNWSHNVGLAGINCGWQNGAGQNQQYPPPVFANHYIVRVAPTNYDPSYGSPAQPNDQAWENNAIDGLMKFLGLPAPNVGYIKGAPNAVQPLLLLAARAFPNYT